MTRRRPPQSSEAFDKLYREHIDLVYRYAHRLCGEPESAKDLVQETFLNAYRGLKHFRLWDKGLLQCNKNLAFPP